MTNVQLATRNSKLPWWLWAYDAALAAAGAVYLPYYALVRRPGHPGLAQRCGRYPDALRAALAAAERPVWVHAVSVGEALAALPLLAALRGRYPHRRWVVSTTTPTGQRVARERLPADDVVFYAPWDLSPCVRRALAAVRPRLFLGLETELWPNLLLRLGAAGVPIAVVNGRVSARSFPRYRIGRRVLAPALAQVRLWAMQTAADAERIITLGVEPARVRVVGNLKADAALPPRDEARLRALRQQLGCRDGVPIWVAGSTHPGEEVMVMNAWRQVRVDQRSLHLILVPRHPERVSDIERLVRRAGVAPARWSQIRQRPAAEPWEDGTVVLVDTLGELPQFYAAADMVFVGGSLVPHGGHNLLEPAQLAKATVTGPYTANFQSVAELLQAAGGLQIVTTVEALAAQIRQWLARPEQRRQVGERARTAVASQQGAVARTVELLGESFGPTLQER